MLNLLPAATSSRSKPAPWFTLFLAALAATAWLTLSLRDTETRLSRTAELLARTESRLDRSRSEVRDLQKSVDEVKKMVGTLVEDLGDPDRDEEEEFADENSGEDGPYLANENSAPSTSRNSDNL
jgi:septal ring factor EnvC (AmiA/AmiB activator)